MPSTLIGKATFAIAILLLFVTAAPVAEPGSHNPATGGFQVTFINQATTFLFEIPDARRITFTVDSNGNLYDIIGHPLFYDSVERYLRAMASENPLSVDIMCDQEPDFPLSSLLKAAILVDRAAGIQRKGKMRLFYDPKRLRILR
jgi:hypothetical protein